MTRFILLMVLWGLLIPVTAQDLAWEMATLSAVDRCDVPTRCAEMVLIDQQAMLRSRLRSLADSLATNEVRLVPTNRRVGVYHVVLAEVKVPRWRYHEHEDQRPRTKWHHCGEWAYAASLLVPETHPRRERLTRAGRVKLYSVAEPLCRVPGVTAHEQLACWLTTTPPLTTRATSSPSSTSTSTSD